MVTHIKQLFTGFIVLLSMFGGVGFFLVIAPAEVVSAITFVVVTVIAYDIGKEYAK